MRRAFRAQWAPLFVTIALAGIVLSVTIKSFGSSYNIFVILQAAGVDAIIGLAQMVVLAAGDMSLAVGGIGGLVTVTVGNLFAVQHWPSGLVILAGLAVGALSGLVNGIIITKSGVSAFIITLATGTVFTGIGYGVTKSYPYSDVPSDLVRLGQGRVGFFPYLLVVTLVTCAVVGGALRWLPSGRALLAVGGNKDAAMLSGLSRPRAVLAVHLASGFLAALAAVTFVGVLRSATPDTGDDWLIISFAVPIIGGTALMGGEGSAFGCLVAAVLLATIDDALIVLNISTYAIEMAEGLLIFGAVAAGRIGQRAARSTGPPAAIARGAQRPAQAPSARAPAADR